MLKIRKTNKTAFVVPPSGGKAGWPKQPPEGGTTNVFRLVLLGFTFLLAACGQPEIVPVAIHPEDVCASCKMAISEKQFAAEFITKDGDAMKFDDIGCLLDYLKNKADRGQIAAYFVVDSDSRQWIKAEDAYFIRSPEFKTPMSGGILAFQDKSKAEDAAAGHQGRLFRFANLPAELSD